MADDKDNNGPGNSGAVLVAALIAGAMAFSFSYFDEETLLMAADRAGITFAVTYCMGMITQLKPKSGEAETRKKKSGNKKPKRPSSKRVSSKRASMSRQDVMNRIKELSSLKEKSNG